MRSFPTSCVKEKKHVWKHHPANYEYFIKTQWFLESGIENKDTTSTIRYAPMILFNPNTFKIKYLHFPKCKSVIPALLHSLWVFLCRCSWHFTSTKTSSPSSRRFVLGHWDHGSRPLDMEIPKRPPSTNQLQRAVVDACQSASAPTKSNGMYFRAWEWRGYQCIAAVGTSCSNRNTKKADS